jgi:prepilin-type N-terminal cleavage/methylation domain-containing protein
MKKGFTLIEFLISLIIVSLIVLALVSVDISSRRFFSGSDYRSRLQNEASPVIGLMTKDITRATGDVGNATNTNIGINITSPGPASGRRLEIRLPDNATTFTPYNYSDNPWVVYEFIANPSYEIRKGGPANPRPSNPLTSYEVVARNITNCTFSYIDNSRVSINVTARRFPPPAPVNNDNPEVILRTEVSHRLSASH